LPHFSRTKKDEGWWTVVGDIEKNSLLGIKRITLNKTLSVKLDFTCPTEAGEHLLKVFFMSDSYSGCDQEFDLQITTQEGAEDSEEENEAMETS